MDMKTLAPLALAALCAAAACRTASARLLDLMVDEHGNLNSTNAVATVADLSSAAASALLAEAKAEAASSAAARGTNMVAAVANAIAASELAVYVRGNVSAFEAAVLFGPDDRIEIYGFDVERAADGTAEVSVRWFSTVPIGSSDVGLKWADSLALSTSGTSTVYRTIMADSNVPLGQQVVGGNTYENAYLMTKAMPALPQSFFRVWLEPDAPSGDGSTMEISGVKGGYTGTVAAGETLTVSNGVIVGKGGAQ